MCSIEVVDRERGGEIMSTKMAEACGSCYRSFRSNRKINESLKCACQRPFFSQTVARNNLPTDRDCWIEVPKRFVRHYSSSFGEIVNFEGDDGRSYSCALVGSDIAIVGYGFEWYDFASSHNVCMGDQIVFTLMEKSRFLVQVYRAIPVIPPTAITVKVENDVDIQVAGAQDWLLAKARRSGSNIPHSDATADLDRVQWEALGGEATRAPETNDEIDVNIPSSKVVSVRKNADVRKGSNKGAANTSRKTDGQSVQSKVTEENLGKHAIIGDAEGEDAEGEDVESEDAEGEDVESEDAESGDAESGDPERETAENENAEASSASTSDSDWSLKGLKREKREMFDRRNRSGQKDSMEDDCETSGTTTSADSMTEEEELRNSSRMKRDTFPSRARPVSRSKRGKAIDGSMSEGALGGDDGKKSTRSPYLYVPQHVNKVHTWAEPGTTRRRTYVSKRGPVTPAEKERVFEAAKACSITHNSYLRQLENDNVYRALVLAIPAPWWRENMPQTRISYKGTLVDEKGNSWQMRVRGTEIFWGNFSLDHYLEEGDVVVMELVDSRLKSLKFLVHIFPVVNVRMTLTGKAGWAIHYAIVEGIKKQEASRRLLKAQGKGRLKRKRRSGSSHMKMPNPTDLPVDIHKRLTRHGRSRAALKSFEETSATAIPKRVHAEHEHENTDILPLDSNDGGPTPSETDSYKKALPREVLMEVKMEYVRDSNDGGPTPLETDSHSKFAKALPRKVKTEDLN